MKAVSWITHWDITSPWLNKEYCIVLYCIEAFEYNAKSKKTKPIFSNSAKGYYAKKCYFLMLSAAVHGVTNNILNLCKTIKYYFRLIQFKVQSQINVIKECEQVKIINET